MFASSKNRWLIVIASMFGLTVSFGAISVFAFSVFLKPVCIELGVSRSLMTSGLLVASVICGLGTPAFSVLTDRWGSRRMLLLGIPFFGFSIAAFAAVQPSPMSIYGLFVLFGLAGAAHSTVPYAKVIASWFDRERGLALGIAMSGMGLSVFLVPPIAVLLIEIMGWRAAYMGLGVTIALLAFIPVFLFVRDPHPHEWPERETRSDNLPGMTTVEAIRSWRFWVISIGFFVGVTATHGTLVHAVSLLTDRGMSMGFAIVGLSLSGVGIIAGRIASGWLLDRFHGPSVAIFFLLLTAVGIGCLISGRSSLTVPGMLLCGAGVGANVGVMAYFASRYFGMRSYGTIYGLMFGLFLIGIGVGPYLSALSFDLLHSYRPAMLAYIVGLLVVSLMFVPLGRYPFAGARLAVTGKAGRQPLRLDATNASTNV